MNKWVKLYKNAKRSSKGLHKFQRIFVFLFGLMDVFIGIISCSMGERGLACLCGTALPCTMLPELILGSGATCCRWERSPHRANRRSRHHANKTNVYVVRMRATKSRHVLWPSVFFWLLSSLRCQPLILWGKKTSNLSLFYVKIYLHYRMPRIALGSTLQAFVQVLAVAGAFYIGLSRVSDNKHHPTDVLAGMVIGFLVGVFSVGLANVML